MFIETNGLLSPAPEERNVPDVAPPELRDRATSFYKHSAPTALIVSEFASGIGGSGTPKYR